MLIEGGTGDYWAVGEYLYARLKYRASLDPHIHIRSLSVSSQLLSCVNRPNCFSVPGKEPRTRDRVGRQRDTTLVDRRDCHQKKCGPYHVE